jgi:hypothetical protein
MEDSIDAKSVHKSIGFLLTDHGAEFVSGLKYSQAWQKGRSRFNNTLKVAHYSPTHPRIYRDSISLNYYRPKYSLSNTSDCLSLHEEQSNKPMNILLL